VKIFLNSELVPFVGALVLNIINYTLSTVLYFLNTLSRASYILLASLFTASLMKVLIPRYVISKLSLMNIRSVLLITLIGSLIPSCSYCSLPLAYGLGRLKVPKNLVLTFITVAPTISLPTLALMTYLLGTELVLTYLATVLLLALTTNLVGIKYSRISGSLANCSLRTLRSNGKSFPHLLLIEFSIMTNQIIPRLVLGILISSLVTSLHTYLSNYLGGNDLLLTTFLMLTLPTYLCPLGTIPLTSYLINRGVDPSLVLSLLIMGSLINPPSLIVNAKLLGKGLILKYVLVITSLTPLITYVVLSLINNL